MCCGEEIQTTAFTRMIHEQLLEEIQTTAFTRMIHEQLLEESAFNKLSLIC
jgi:hypothetical protein